MVEGQREKPIEIHLSRRYQGGIYCCLLCKRPPVNANQWDPYIWKRLNECVSRKGRWRKRSRQRRRLRTCHVRLSVYLNEKQVQNYWNDNPLFGIENEWNDEVPLNVYACTHAHTHFYSSKPISNTRIQSYTLQIALCGCYKNQIKSFSFTHLCLLPFYYLNTKKATWTQPIEWEEGKKRNKSWSEELWMKLN